jgi:hypothetical protein
MRGPIPAGTYHLVASGSEMPHDGVVHADIIHRDMSGDHVLASADQMVRDSSTGPGNLMDAMLQVGAVTASCGDILAVRLRLLSGSAPLVEVVVDLYVP